ncbi:MAG: hypothetical protein MJE68_14075, partial [Proteobacteria bacterium]|nr:hypothetical protein [Pseudomonadota bacterium]
SADERKQSSDITLTVSRHPGGTTHRSPGYDKMSTTSKGVSVVARNSKGHRGQGIQLQASTAASGTTDAFSTAESILGENRN